MQIPNRKERLFPGAGLLPVRISNSASNPGWNLRFLCTLEFPPATLSPVLQQERGRESQIKIMLFLASQARVDRFQGLETIDYITVIVYFSGVLALGYYFSKRQRSVEEYFLAGRGMPWFVVGLSMYASLLSTIAYLSEPGEFIKNGPGVLGRQLHVPFTLTIAMDP